MSQHDAYRAAGVDYNTLDAGKRTAMAKALSTSPLLAARGGRAVDASRGEPAFVFELGEQTFAFVVEGLGTKSVIARHVLETQGIDRSPMSPRHRRRDPQRPLLRRRAATRRQRLLRHRRLGVVPASAERSSPCSRVAPGLRTTPAARGGVGSPRRSRDARRGGHRARRRRRGRRAGGTLRDLGRAPRPGDEIVLVASSGLHANGASLARLVAGRLPEGYATRLGASGRGHAGRGPAGAVRHVRAAARSRARRRRRAHLHQPHHRPRAAQADASRQALTYRIERLPEVPEVLSFLVEQAGLDAAAAYSTFNMGSGYARLLRGRRRSGDRRARRGVGPAAVLAGTWRTGPGRSSSSPWTCASPGTSSSSP